MNKPFAERSFATDLNGIDLGSRVAGSPQPRSNAEREASPAKGHEHQVGVRQLGGDAGAQSGVACQHRVLADRMHERQRPCPVVGVGTKRRLRAVPRADHLPPALPRHHRHFCPQPPQALQLGRAAADWHQTHTSPFRSGKKRGLRLIPSPPHLRCMVLHQIRDRLTHVASRCSHKPFDLCSFFFLSK